MSYDLHGQGECLVSFGCWLLPLSLSANCGHDKQATGKVNLAIVLKCNCISGSQ